jgi:hypothetical protein
MVRLAMAEHSINLGHCILLNITSILVKKTNEQSLLHKASNRDQAAP